MKFARLEKLLGVPLFNRQVPDKRKLMLTEGAHALVAETRKVLVPLEAFASKLERIVEQYGTADTHDAAPDDDAEVLLFEPDVLPRLTDRTTRKRSRASRNVAH